MRTRHRTRLCLLDMGLVSGLDSGGLGEEPEGGFVLGLEHPACQTPKVLVLNWDDNRRPEILYEHIFCSNRAGRRCSSQRLPDGLGREGRHRAQRFPPLPPTRNRARHAFGEFCTGTTSRSPRRLAGASSRAGHTSSGEGPRTLDPEGRLQPEQRRQRRRGACRARRQFERLELCPRDVFIGGLRARDTAEALAEASSGSQTDAEAVAKRARVCVDRQTGAPQRNGRIEQLDRSAEDRLRGFGAPRRGRDFRSS